MESPEEQRPPYAQPESEEEVEDMDEAISPTSTLGRPQLPRFPYSNPNFSSLPPLVTSPPSSRAMSIIRKPPYTSKRLSTFSNNSGFSRSRPQSTVFPMFHSSLPYALVRDFAYDVQHPMHYGPPPDGPSGASTPADEIGRRLSDPAPQAWSTSKLAWGVEPSFGSGGDDIGAADLRGGVQLPATSFGDGPPYNEDADLLSPIVTTNTKHKKTRSSAVDYFSGVPRSSAGTNNENLRPTIDQSLGNINGPTSAPRSNLSENMQQAYTSDESIPNNSYQPEPASYTTYSDDDDEEYPYSDDDNPSRLSRNYHFHIASPDEEFHGKAVALFDFERENENELPLFEGQVIWVSYRHGQGWLVAQDPKNGETGLVPEAYVRLIRDIEGGLNRLIGEDAAVGLEGEDVDGDGDEDLDAHDADAEDADTPTTSPDRERRGSSNTGGKQTGAGGAYLSSFSTSSKDLQPYPLATTTPTSATGPGSSAAYGTTSQVSTPKVSQGGFMAEMRDGQQQILPAQGYDGTHEDDDDDDDNDSDLR